MQAKKEPVTLKAFFALAAHGGLFHAPFVASLFQLLPALERRGVGVAMTTVSFPDIEVARNYLATEFVDNKPDCTHMLIVDADMGFPPQLVFDMVALDADIAGVAAPRKQIDLGKVQGAYGDTTAAVRRGLSFVHGALDRSEERNGFVRTEACGTGVMLIKRRVFEDMAARLPEIVDTVRFKAMPFGDRFTRFLTPFTKVRLDDRELSTDYSFCHRWVAGCGGEVWINTRHAVTHTGSFDFTGALDG